MPPLLRDFGAAAPSGAACINPEPSALHLTRTIYILNAHARMVSAELSGALCTVSGVGGHGQPVGSGGTGYIPAR